jgi:hypothetical protein
MSCKKSGWPNGPKWHLLVREARSGRRLPGEAVKLGDPQTLKSMSGAGAAGWEGTRRASRAEVMEAFFSSRVNQLERKPITSARLLSFNRFPKRDF